MLISFRPFTITFADPEKGVALSCSDPEGEGYDVLALSIEEATSTNDEWTRVLIANDSHKLIWVDTEIVEFGDVVRNP